MYYDVKIALVNLLYSNGMDVNDVSYAAGRLLAPVIIVFAIVYIWQRTSKKRKLTKKELIKLAIIAVGIGLLLTVLMAVNRVAQSL